MGLWVSVLFCDFAAFVFWYCFACLGWNLVILIFGVLLFCCFDVCGLGCGVWGWCKTEILLELVVGVDFLPRGDFGVFRFCILVLFSAYSVLCLLFGCFEFVLDLIWLTSCTFGFVVLLGFGQDRVCRGLGFDRLF